MLIYLPVTSRPLIFPAARSSFVSLKARNHPFYSLHSEFLSPFKFATHETEDPFATPQFFDTFSTPFRTFWTVGAKRPGNSFRTLFALEHYKKAKTVIIVKVENREWRARFGFRTASVLQKQWLFKKQGAFLAKKPPPRNAFAMGRQFYFLFAVLQTLLSCSTVSPVYFKTCGLVNPILPWFFC